VKTIKKIDLIRLMNIKKNIYYYIPLALIVVFFLIKISYSVPEAPESSHSADSAKTALIPDSIVALSSGYVMVVDKKFQKIYVFQKSDHFSKVFEAPCSTGQNSGSKQIAGDKKTPNGVFFTTRILRNPGPPDVYGSMAFPLDYPTLADKRAGRDGSNIWIHGTTASLLPKQSQGCVVLRDNDLKRLAEFIFLNRTPVIISESINWVPQHQASPAKKDLENILTAWNKAFIEKDLRKMDSLYRQGTEIKGKRREELNEKIRNLDFINKHFVLEPRDISILQEGNNAVIIFDQIFSVAGNNTFQGFYNKLILEKVKDGWLIVDDVTSSDQALALAEHKQKEVKTPVVNIHKDIQSVIKKWATSWESGNVTAYRNCYTHDFKSREMDLDAWIAHKSNVRQKSKKIKISIDDLKISANGENATATFIQHYSSSVLKSKGKKTLNLKKTGHEWKIYREIMEP